MKNKLLLVTCWIASLIAGYAQAEYRINFSYDSAGNQTLRNRVCINCSSKTQAVDSTLVSDLDEKNLSLEDNEADSSGVASLIAYPNPVTDILTIEWVAETKTVKQLMLFSSNNTNVFNSNINPGQSSLDISFSGYPPGMYIALVLYSDGSKQSFKTLKK